ncbi:dihydrofolate reductase [Pseudoglutamicibacter albus]|uniref:Dihydrofolate reductase n=1 Tax=Pseudoglutamicibacter albus DNF00011 TaxID=1401063 RepID=A0A095ZLM1_9MICC|nr:dihydrofolate reductase [Pseudoglutamicibacter albus]KGF19512.1 hypothetical protein HMPREF2128_10660 [Pseudoglutamicibacter albus DNF00011]
MHKHFSEDFLPHESARQIGMIWAQSAERVIGVDGDIPWRLPEDLAFFKHVTEGHPVIMGRKTWESIPAAFRPFSNRTNIVLTTQAETRNQVSAAGGHAVDSIAEALDIAYNSEGSEQVWIVGGGAIYEALEPMANLAVVTTVDTQVEGDTLAPELGVGWEHVTSSPAGEGWIESEKQQLRYRVDVYQRKG